MDAPIVSPDGSRIAFPAADKNATVHLWLRDLQSPSAQKIPGTTGANYPFWSADGRFIGFFANGKLMKVELSGGMTQALCDVSDERGGTWNQDGVILFSPHPLDGLYRISSAGGVPTQVTFLDPAAEESSHRFPYFLPDGKHFIFFVKANKRESGIYIGSLDSREKSLLLPSDRSAVYSSGYLLFQRSSTLLAQAFDTRKLKLSGEAIPLRENVRYFSPNFGTHGMAVSDSNLLTYIEGYNRSQLLWFNRNGNQEGSMSPPDEYGGAPVFSPDGKKFAIQVGDAGYAQIWLYDSSDGSRSRFTFSQSYDVSPCWSADGTRISFASNRTGLYKLYLRDARGIGNDELLYESKNSCIPVGWSPDNQYMIFSEIDAKTKWDLWVLHLGEQRKVFPFLVTEAGESSARFSPDGKWVAYASDESGRPEIYVQPFLAEKSGKWQISTNGGFTPRWSKDGKELFYLAQDNQIMCSAVKLSPIFEFTVPKPLFAIRPYYVRRISGWNETFEPSPDGRRFGVHVAASAPINITVVLNWPLLLNSKK